MGQHLFFKILFIIIYTMDSDHILTICRLCLNIDTDLENLFHFEKISDKILIRIMECTAIKIDLADGYSNFICANCLDLLNKFHDFRIMCLKSDLILKNYRGMVNRSELANYLEKCKNSEIQSNPEIYDKRNSIKEESNNVDLSSLNNDLKLKNEIQLDFTDNSEEILFRDECSDDLDDTFIETNDPLIETNDRLIETNDPLLQTKLRTHLISERKESVYSKQQIRRKQNKLTEPVKKTVKKSKKELRVCYICGKLTINFFHHLQTHKSVRDWKCEKCGKMFPNRQGVKRHQYFHNPNKRHICEKCGTSCVNNYALARHIRTVHFPTRAYECSICSRRFENAYNLKVHKMKHSDEKSYFKCKSCPEYFTNNREFREHKVNRHNITPPLFKCEKCNLTFAYKLQLQAHKKRAEHETGETFECTKCDKKFDTQRGYRKHLQWRHELENETKTIDTKCEVCNKTFKQLRYLKQHEKLHLENGKKFKCEVCGKKFLYKAFLKEHTRIHTGERPAKCDFCNNAYISFRQLRKHIKSHKFVQS